MRGLGVWCGTAVVLLACGGGSNAGSGSDGGTGSGTSAASSMSSTVSATSVASASASGTTTSTGSTTAVDTGEQADVTCVANTDETYSETGAARPNPTAQHTASGSNGAFTDECDGDGNLVEYVCELMEDCAGEVNPECNFYQTGAVVPVTFDCAGTCVNGTCPARCPDFGDTLEYTLVDGMNAEFDNLEDGRHYACVMSFDQAGDTYDCLANPTVGTTVVISSLGLGSDWCTGTQSFNVGTGEPQQCTYMCQIVP